MPALCTTEIGVNMEICFQKIQESHHIYIQLFITCLELILRPSGGNFKF